mmetsp:Transcript_31478/g.83922  ORF Transcript_31478/g.83922 Transcript_31478/m.83922 type:complete len:209 (+) Transcript_31478:856-1482(+)
MFVVLMQLLQTHVGSYQVGTRHSNALRDTKGFLQSQSVTSHRLPEFCSGRTEARLSLLRCRESSLGVPNLDAMVLALLNNLRQSLHISLRVLRRCKLSMQTISYTSAQIFFDDVCDTLLQDGGSLTYQRLTCSVLFRIFDCSAKFLNRAALSNVAQLPHRLLELLFCTETLALSMLQRCQPLLHDYDGFIWNVRKLRVSKGLSRCVYV